MKRLDKKLSLWVVSFATIILVTSLGFMFGVSRKAIRQEAINRATDILENTTLRVNGILDKVVVAANNTDWLVCRHLDKPDSMFVYSRKILENNPNLNGCSIAFEPDYFKDKGSYFSAYTYNDNGTILTTQEGNDHYQ
ncbi:MAG: signal protein, partial [Bacteroidales bacterium]|nr:signal protein [Bacteroidales bacterium]